MMPESARNVIRNAWLPLLSREEALALRAALAADSPEVAQGCCTVPAPVPALKSWPVEAADPVTWVGWRCQGLDAVGEAAEYFAQVCYRIDQEMGEPAACRYLLHYLDDAPRGEMRAALVAELDEYLAAAGAAEVA